MFGPDFGVVESLMLLVYSKVRSGLVGGFFDGCCVGVAW